MVTDKIRALTPNEIDDLRRDAVKTSEEMKILLDEKAAEQFERDNPKESKDGQPI